MSEEVRLMKGNEAITPQSEVLETLEELMPWDTTGMVVLQAESEVAAINMVYGGAACGKAVFTSSSSPGVSLKQEGISYIAAGELPALIINVMRGGPGLGTIQPSQADYFQTTKGGGLAPATVQEMADFVALGFDLAFKYRTPAIILADGIVGQMMEKVVLPPQRPRRTPEEIAAQCPWAITGKPASRQRNIMTTLELMPQAMEEINIRLQQKYRMIEENEVRFATYGIDDCDYLIVAFGSIARISQKAIEMAAEQGVKIGIIRPITLWPFPSAEIERLAAKVKGIMVVELNAGQMIEDVRLACHDSVPVYHFGRLGGIVPNPQEILDAFFNHFPQN